MRLRRAALAPRSLAGRPVSRRRRCLVSLLAASALTGSIAGWWRTAAAVVPVRRPARPPTAAGMEPPSVPFPPARIAGAVTVFDDPDGFTPAAFERALAAGGTIRFGPGTFDISGMRAQALDGVRITGAGKHRTVLRGGFSPSDYRRRARRDVLGVVRGRIEIEDITFEAVRAVLIGAGDAPVSFPRTVDRRAVSALVVGARMPATAEFGMAWRNVAVDRSGRAVLFAGLHAFHNVLWHHVDVTDCWHGFHVRCNRACSHWYFYDCLFRDLIFPDSPVDGDRTDWHGLPQGVGMGNDLNVAAQGVGRDVRFEHCTFDGITSAYRGIPSGRRFYRHAAIWMGGNRDDCWVRRTVFRNIGFDSRGQRPPVFDRAGCVVYSKGRLVYDKIVVENCCLGWEGLFNTKGGSVVQWGVGTDDFHNIYIKGVVRGPTRHPRAIVGPHPWQCVIDNVHVEDVAVMEGFVPGGYGHVNRGTTEIRNVTVRNFAVQSNDKRYVAVFAPADTHATRPPDYVLDNIKVEGFRHVSGTEPPAVITLEQPYSDSATYGRLEARNISFDLSGEGYVDAALVRIEAELQRLHGEPSGEIRGISGRAYSWLRSSDEAEIAGRRLGPYHGAVAGADLAWMSAGVVGCNPER